MLPKHPDQYADEELETWIRHLVDERVSEGPRLDYKETINLRDDKREAAKDISSFANEIGGTVIYGIPEDRQSAETAIPCKPYGIDSVPDFESRLENIYVDSISPSLPEWRIRKVDLTEYPGKVVYIVWTPESCLGPHMVQAYEDKRYYRRGQLRAVPMDEHELRVRYERTRNVERAVEDFLNSPQLDYIRQYFAGKDFVSHYAACPALLAAEIVDFTTPDMKSWLGKNRYISMSWFDTQTSEDWSHSAYGVRTKFVGEHLWVEIHRNGAISHWEESSVRPDEEKCKLLYLEELKAIEGFLQFSFNFYQKLSYFGALRFRVRIENKNNQTLFLNRPSLTFRSPEPLLITHDGNLSIDFLASGSELFENPNTILKQIGDRMFRAFGVENADCFDSELNLRK